MAGAGRVCLVAGHRVFVVAQMMGRLALQGALGQGFGELLQNSVLPRQVFGFPAVSRQFVNQLRCDGYNVLS